MARIRAVLKKVFTPITIMLIPHSNARSLSLKIPSAIIYLSLFMCTIGTVYVVTMVLDALEYKKMKQKVDYYSAQFMELQSTISALKKTENEFQKLFSLKSKEQVLENLDNSDSGSIDMESLKRELKTTMENVGEIRDYLSQQRNQYISTPKGWPVAGHITSPYGQREHPKSGAPEFHSGIDIAAEPGRPVKATADGIVIFAGWSGNNGNLVVLQHGFGFSTFYAHNKMVAVKIGQKVKRGDIIGYIGSTGNSTGPHVHYEVWHSRRSVNPARYLEGRT